MATELENTPNDAASVDEKLKMIQVSEVAWKQAKIHAVQHDTTIKAVVEAAVAKYVESSHAA